MRRRRIAALLTLLAAVALVMYVRGGPAVVTTRGSKSKPEPARQVGVLIGSRRVATIRPRRGLVAAQQTLERDLPARRTARLGSATVTYRTDPAATARRALASRDGTVQAAARPIASQIDAPVVAQRLRNNCESAALSILLATQGVDAPQLDLQDALPRSGPADPDDSGPQRRWGDPALGYVGRADGGGVAGGFGVYEGPVATVARRWGVQVLDLSGRAPAAVYARLRAGMPVMVWVGLSDGPYGEWLSPSGKPIRVNFGEHTVVLNGIRTDGTLRVVNPLEGTAEIWTQERFETMWKRLGRRALSA